MPALYQYYDPNQEQQKAEARRQQMVGNLMNMGSKRQRFMDEQYARAEKERADQEAAINGRASALNGSALDETAQGAMMGASFGGGPGAIIGGAAGSILGGIKGFGQRKKEGTGFWSNLGQSLLDVGTGGLFEAGKSAIKDHEFSPFESAIPLVGMAGGMAGKKFFGGGGPSPVMDQSAMAGNAIADQERWNRNNTVENANAMLAAPGSVLGHNADDNYGAGHAFSAPASEDVMDALRKRRSQGPTGLT